jgi:hypothetical protein
MTTLLACGKKHSFQKAGLRLTVNNSRGDASDALKVIFFGLPV